MEHNNPRALTGDNVFYDNVRGGAWLKGAWGMDDEELLLFRDSGGDGGGHGLPHTWLSHVAWIPWSQERSSMYGTYKTWDSTSRPLNFVFDL